MNTNGHGLAQIYPVKSSDGGLPNAAFNRVNPGKSSNGGLTKVEFNRASKDKFSSPALKTGLDK